MPFTPPWHFLYHGYRTMCTSRRHDNHQRLHLFDFSSVRWITRRSCRWELCLLCPSKMLVSDVNTLTPQRQTENTHLYKGFRFGTKGQKELKSLWTNECQCKLSFNVTKRKTPNLQFWPSSEHYAQRQMSYLVWDMNTACVMLLQGVNEKPFCCQCYTITPFGSYLKVCVCVCVILRVFLCLWFVVHTYSYTCLLSVRVFDCGLLRMCSFVCLWGSVHMRVCLLEWTLHPHVSVQIWSCVTEHA